MLFCQPAIRPAPETALVPQQVLLIRSGQPAAALQAAGGAGCRQLQEGGGSAAIHPAGSGHQARRRDGPSWIAVAGIATAGIATSRVAPARKAAVDAIGTWHQADAARTGQSGDQATESLRAKTGTAKPLVPKAGSAELAEGGHGQGQEQIVHGVSAVG